MFWLIRNATERYAELGRVHCPRQKCDVELDICLGCPYAQEVSAGRAPFVRCDPPLRILPAPF